MYQKTCIFHLILLGIPSSLVFFVKNRGVGGEGGGLRGSLLNGQNLLSMTKVICWRSLKEKIAQITNSFDDCAAECVYISVPSGRRVYLFFLGYSKMHTPGTIANSQTDRAPTEINKVGAVVKVTILVQLGIL